MGVDGVKAREGIAEAHSTIGKLSINPLHVGKQQVIATNAVVSFSAVVEIEQNIFVVLNPSGAVLG